MHLPTRKALRDAFVFANRHAPLRFAGKRSYDVMKLAIRKRIAAVPGVRAVYMCHGLALGECFPGLSDFDIAVVFDGKNPLAFYDEMRRAWKLLIRFAPVTDMSVLTVDEFDAWQRIGGGWDPLDEVRHWRLLEGSELRHADFDPASETARLGRMEWALGHFQNLLAVAIKEEQRSSIMAIVARRQLHKFFWNTVLALDPRYLAKGSHKARMRAWMDDNGVDAPVAALQAMHDARFMSGPVTTLRFEIAALAYQLLDQSLALNPLLQRPLHAPLTGDSIALPNQDEVVTRARSLCTSLFEHLGGKLESVVVGSAGTETGYALYVVLRDALTREEIVEALRDVRAIHRVFDDPWFNEHFPAGVPIVCSRRMFAARLQTGRSSLHFFERFRAVLHGTDVYAEALSSGRPDARAENLDIARERVIYSLLLHQVYIGRVKPGLLSFVTFNYPRLALQARNEVIPVTAEEAAARYGGLPARMLARYRGLDLDTVLRTMPLDAFEEAWPLLSSGRMAGRTR
jgi:hypothetical protein